MKKIINQPIILISILCLMSLIGCNEQKEIEEIPTVDSSGINNDVTTNDNSTTNQGYDLNHKYSYVKLLEDGNSVSGLLDLYGSNDYTQAVVASGFTQSGRGTFAVNGNILTLKKTSGIAIDGNLKISKNDGKIWLTLNNGITYVQDDEGYYIRNIESTPGTTQNDDSDSESQENKEDSKVQDEFLTYIGTATDEQSGLSQTYTLSIASDFSSASIGGGPYTSIQDQGNGNYMWTDGTIIGMNFKLMNGRCILYGPEGDYFCTLYKK
jgi:hypothetical protein